MVIVIVIVIVYVDIVCVWIREEREMRNRGCHYLLLEINPLTPSLLARMVMLQGMRTLGGSPWSARLDGPLRRHA